MIDLRQIVSEARVSGDYTRLIEAIPYSRFLGMRVQAITPELRRQLQLEEDMTGVVVVEVDEGSPAEAAEITSGDIILEVAQQKVTSVESLRQLLEQHGKPGESVLLRVTRPGERPMPKVIKVPAQ